MDSAINRQLALACSAYGKRVTEDMIFVWQEAMEGIDSEDVAEAMKAHISHSEWFPKPAELRRLAVQFAHARTQPENVENYPRCDKCRGSGTVSILTPKSMQDAINHDGTEKELLPRLRSCVAACTCRRGKKFGLRECRGRMIGLIEFRADLMVLWKAGESPLERAKRILMLAPSWGARTEGTYKEFEAYA